MLIMKSVTIAIVCVLSTVSAESNQKTFGWMSDLFQSSGAPIAKPPKEPQVNMQNCGLQFTRSFNEKIVGGRDAAKGEFPWQASIQMQRGNSWFHFCGGSIINEQYILTAAHCCQNLRLSEIRIVLGAYNLKAFNGFEVTSKVSQVIVHEKYDPNTMKNDIALLKLANKIDLSSKGGSPINSVCLPSKTDSLVEGELLQVSGWGRTTEGGSAANVLQVVGVAVIPNSKCNKGNYKGKIYDEMMCAGFGTGGKDACQGDSGGPMTKCTTSTRNGNSVRCIHVGIVSWGYGCARPDNPGVYTKTSNYITWISEKINKRGL